MCVNGVGNPTGIGFRTWSRDPATVRRCVLRDLLLCQKPDTVTLAIGNPIPCRRLGIPSFTEPHREEGTKKKPGRVLVGLPLKVGLDKGNAIGARSSRWF